MSVTWPSISTGVPRAGGFATSAAGVVRITDFGTAPLRTASRTSSRPGTLKRCGSAPESTTTLSSASASIVTTGAGVGSSSPATGFSSSVAALSTPEHV